MLFLIMVASFLFFFFALTGYLAQLHQSVDARKPFLLSVVLMGVLIVVSTEILSLFNAIANWSIAAFWFLILGVGVLVPQARAWFIHGFRHTKLDLSQWRKQEIGLLVGLVVGVTLLFLVAIVAVPNNVDSLLYHIARVMHWTQNDSLRHFPTVYEHQLHKPPYSEMAMLQIRELWGNDQLVNLMQWFSMLTSVIGVSAIAKRLGANRGGQWLSAAFAFSVPMGILQSTSTQNDYASTMWAGLLAYFVVLSLKRELTRLDLSAMAATVGLGLLTKGTFFVYSPPLLALYFLHILRQKMYRKTISQGLILIAAILVLNLGFYIRNVGTYGGPYGTSDWLAQNLGFLGSTRSEAQSAVEADVGDQEPVDDELQTEDAPSRPESILDGVGSWGKKMAMIVAWNFVTPSSWINQRYIPFILDHPQIFPEEYSAEITNAAWNHEDTAGNPVHMTLIFGSLVIVVYRGLTRSDTRTMGYVLSVLAIYGLIPIVINQGPSVWGVRFQLGFFVLWAPIFGVSLSSWGSQKIDHGISLALLVASLPWILLNNTRPMIGMTPWPTRIDSVFTAADEEILFASHPSAMNEYIAITNLINQSSCTDIGLELDSSDREYFIWYLLDAPQSGIRLAYTNALPHLEDYADPTFTPCAIVCTQCGGRTNLLGLPLQYEQEGLSLFSENDVR